MTSKTTFADVNSTKLVNKINDLTIGEDSTDLLVVNSNVNATNGLDVTGGALTITDQAITQTGSGQVTFTGNVGIGTNDPKTNLHVNHDFHIAANSSSWNSTAGKGLYMRYTTNSSQDEAYIQSTDRTSGQDYPLTFEASKFWFKDGNVGIGIENPTEKLEVNGNLKVNGNVESNNKGIIQVKSSSFLGTLSGSSGSWITGLNVSITPSSSTNKIFLNLDLHWSGAQDAYFQGFIYRFVGGSASGQLVVIHNGVGSATRSSFGNRNNSLGDHPYQLENLGFSYLDSPNTTSNISYRVYVRNRGFSHGAFYINYTSSTNDSNRLTGVSTFTAFEVVP